MTTIELLKIAVYFLLILAVTKPLGLYMKRVFCGEKTFLDRVLRPIERLVYRASGVDPKKELMTCRYCGLETLCRVYEKINVLAEEEFEEW